MLGSRSTVSNERVGYPRLFRVFRVPCLSARIADPWPDTNDFHLTELPIVSNQLTQYVERSRPRELQLKGLSVLNRKRSCVQFVLVVLTRLLLELNRLISPQATRLWHLTGVSSREDGIPDSNLGLSGIH